RDEILTTARRHADEMRSQALRILEESVAQEARAEAEFDIQLVAWREEAERHEAERLAVAQAATRQLVTEAEQRAALAEQRAAKASAQAEQTRREAEQRARQLVSTATKNADQLLAQARAQADQLLAVAENEIEPHRADLRRKVDELTTRKDSITSHLAQLRQMLSPPPGAAAQRVAGGGQSSSPAAAPGRSPVPALPQPPSATPRGTSN